MQIICLSSITKRSKGGEVSGYPGRFGHCSYLQVFQSGVARPTAKIVSESGGFRLVGDGIVASVRFGCTITRILRQMWVR